MAATPSGLHPVPLLAGGDLIAAGFQPGPRFGIALDRAYDGQLEEVLRRAAAAGVYHTLTVGTDLASSRRAGS